MNGFVSTLLRNEMCHCRKIAFAKLHTARCILHSNHLANNNQIDWIKCLKIKNKNCLMQSFEGLKVVGASVIWQLNFNCFAFACVKFIAFVTLFLFACLAFKQHSMCVFYSLHSDTALLSKSHVAKEKVSFMAQIFFLWIK